MSLSEFKLCPPSRIIPEFERSNPEFDRAIDRFSDRRSTSPRTLCFHQHHHRRWMHYARTINGAFLQSIRSLQFDTSFQSQGFVGTCTRCMAGQGLDAKSNLCQDFVQALSSLCPLTLLQRWHSTKPCHLVGGSHCTYVYDAMDSPDAGTNGWGLTLHLPLWKCSPLLCSSRPSPFHFVCILLSSSLLSFLQSRLGILGVIISLLAELPRASERN